LPVPLAEVRAEEERQREEVAKVLDKIKKKH
jgi:hypothetical protein